MKPKDDFQSWPGVVAGMFEIRRLKIVQGKDRSCPSCWRKDNIFNAKDYLDDGSPMSENWEERNYVNMNTFGLCAEWDCFMCSTCRRSGYWMCGYKQTIAVLMLLDDQRNSGFFVSKTSETFLFSRKYMQKTTFLFLGNTSVEKGILLFPQTPY